MEINKLALGLGLLGLSACVQGPTPKDYTAFRKEDPHSVLVVPVLNNSVAVNAPDYFLSTISRPFAERGYYVFPAHMVKAMLDQDGLSDAGLVHQADTRRLGAIFDCDTTLYIAIDKWDAKYMLLSTTTEVAFSYTLKSCRTGETLWNNHQEIAYTPQNSSGGNPLANLIADAIVAGLQKAAPNYMPLASQANFIAAGLSGQGLPGGPYLPAQYKKDASGFPAHP